MNKITLSVLILIVLISFLDINASAASTFSGNGTEGSPYIISSYEDLCLLRDIVDSGNSFSDYYFKQTSDIIFPAETNWNPIGEICDDSMIPFSGH